MMSLFSAVFFVLFSKFGGFGRILNMRQSRNDKLQQKEDKHVTKSEKNSENASLHGYVLQKEVFNVFG